MVDNFFAEWGIVIAFFIGLTGLGTFTWNIVKGYKKSQDEKEKTRIEAEKKKEEEIKRDIEIRAERLRKETAQDAEDVKRKVEERAALIKTEIENTAKNLREHNTAMNDMLKGAIHEVDEKVMKMLRDLSERADLTNGNVGLIRNEVQDTKETVQDVKADINALWDRQDDFEKALGVVDKPPDAKARDNRKYDFDRRKQEFDRRKKRTEIRETAEDQGKSNRRYEDEAYDRETTRRSR